MTKIEKMRSFLSKCPYLKDFANGAIDWCGTEPGNFGIMPAGETVIERIEDILGNVTMRKQYNVSLYAMQCTINDIIRIEACGFLENLTEWIDEQSALGLIPTFGDIPDEEYISAQNGMLFELSNNGMTGRYQIQIQATFIKQYTKG